MARHSIGILLTLTLLYGCGGPSPAALQNRTFYQYDEALTTAGAARYEQPYSPLDASPSAGGLGYTGVSVLEGGVRLSRPTRWMIRRASLEPQRRYIEYVSPHQYLFAVYERIDGPKDPWGDIAKGYEEDAKAAGAQLLASRIPVAARTAQGRAYTVSRSVRAARAPFTTTSREVLLRGDHRVILVQIVFQGDSLAPVSDELLRVIDTLEVL